MVKPQTSNLEASFGFRCLEIGQNQGTQGTIQIVIVNPAPSVFITPIIKTNNFVFSDLFLLGSFLGCILMYFVFRDWDWREKHSIRLLMLQCGTPQL